MRCSSPRLLRTLLVLSVPTIIEEVLATLLQYVDTAMVGTAGRAGDGVGQYHNKCNMAGQQHSRCCGHGHAGTHIQEHREPEI